MIGPAGDSDLTPPAPSTPLADRMGWLVRIKAKPIL
jgi:hypothetical protein